MRALIVLLLAAWIAVPHHLEAQEIVTEEVDYVHQGVALQGYLAYPKGSLEQLPGVLLVHEWWGHNEYVRRRAREFAALGYVAFALDMYGKGVSTEDPKKAAELSKPFYDNRTLMRERALAGLEQLKQNNRVISDKLAALGYCFGGSVALELARAKAPLLATISFHGGLGTPQPAASGSIAGGVLALNGADDPMVPLSERQAFMEEMRRAGADWMLVEFGDAVHAFTNPGADAKNMKGVKYNPKADTRSFEMAADFLAEKIGPQNNRHRPTR